MNADIFLERAKQLSDVRNLLQGEPAYASATALLAVHAAIAFNDAVLIRLTGKRGGGESHLNAVQMTIRACRARKIDNRGAEHLKMLLSSKTQISYGNEAVSLEIATRLSLASERFQFWGLQCVGRKTMSMTMERELPRLSNRRFHGRAINAVGEMLRKHLTVPEIYLEPRIAGNVPIDVLAVDRAGSGDFHGVIVTEGLSLKSPAQRRALVAALKRLPFHFKYVAIPDFAADLGSESRFTEASELFDQSGIGRVGLLSVSKTLLDATSPLNGGAIIQVVAPERFRVQGEGFASVERFIAKAKPDISVRI